MTEQQLLAQRVLNLSDEGAKLVRQLLNSLNPLLFIGGKTEVSKKVDVSRHFGVGKGIIQNADEFDSFNREIADLYERF